MKKIFEKIICLVLGYIPVLIAAGVLSSGLYITQPVLSAICISLGMLAVGAVLLIKWQRYLQKTILRVILFCVIFCMGTLCYYFAETETTGDVIISACAALAEFFPSRGTYESQLSTSTSMRWFYGLSYFFAISLLVGIFGKKLTNKWELFMSSFFCSKRRVFWCNIPAKKERQLADRIREEHPCIRCIFSVEEFAIDKVAELIENIIQEG